MEFSGKRVIVTGAGGVHGSQIVKAFAKQGARICISDIRSDVLRELSQNEMLRESVEMIHETNLLDRTSIDSLIAAVDQTWGTPDIVINNAGIYPNQTLLNMTREEWDHVLGVNLFAPFELIREFAQRMIRNDIHGSFVNIISASAFRPRIGAGHYAVSKAGLAMLTRAFALELAPYQIRVNSVSPGFAPGSEVNTLSQAYVESMVESIPLGRTSGPEDAAAAIMFLCSDRASYITGTSLMVDGGSSAGNFRLPAGDHQVKA